MDGHLISVLPVDGGWCVDTSLAGHPLMFLSGAEAERKARSLAQVIAGAGIDTRILVHDRRSALIGTVHFYAGDLQGARARDPAGAARNLSDRWVR